MVEPKCLGCGGLVDGGVRGLCKACVEKACGCYLEAQRVQVAIEQNATTMVAQGFAATGKESLSPQALERARNMAKMFTYLWTLDKTNLELFLATGVKVWHEKYNTQRGN